MNNKYTALDVANYIIWYVNKKELKPLGSLTPLKLQKILYYVASSYFKKYDELLFSEPFQKWQYGPVVKDVYHEFKSVGIYHIDKPKAIIEIDKSAPFGFSKKQFDEGIFLSNSKFLAVANSVIDKLITRRAFDLVEMTHEEYAWKHKEKEILEGIHELVYTNEELKFAKDV